jgi:NAD(P)-dependent dehydrogenase (short-subunit alcohol dehydrogenase family)
VALIAGAAPLARPLQHQTWETFSVNWNTDVRITFNWLREALLLPLHPGSRIIVMSSGAALRGSPLSGGYAGAKATQRFIADYAAQEAERNRLDITVTSVLPQITPATDLGRPFVAAYAARSGLGQEEYQAQLGEPVTPQTVGDAFVQLATDSLDPGARAYLLTAAGMKPLPS